MTEQELFFEGQILAGLPPAEEIRERAFVSRRDEPDKEGIYFAAITNRRLALVLTQRDEVSGRIKALNLGWEQYPKEQVRSVSLADVGGGKQVSICLANGKRMELQIDPGEAAGSQQLAFALRAQQQLMGGVSVPTEPLQDLEAELAAAESQLPQPLVAAALPPAPSIPPVVRPPLPPQVASSGAIPEFIRRARPLKAPSQAPPAPAKRSGPGNSSVGVVHGLALAGAIIFGLLFVFGATWAIHSMRSARPRFSASPRFDSRATSPPVKLPSFEYDSSRHSGSYQPPTYTPPSYQPPTYTPPSYQPPRYTPPSYEPPKFPTVPSLRSRSGYPSASQHIEKIHQDMRQRHREMQQRIQRQNRDLMRGHYSPPY